MSEKSEKGKWNTFLYLRDGQDIHNTVTLAEGEQNKRCSVCRVWSLLQAKVECDNRAF